MRYHFYKITGEYWQHVEGFSGEGRYGMDVDGWRYVIGWVESASQLLEIADYKIATLREALGQSVDWEQIYSQREGW